MLDRWGGYSVLTLKQKGEKRILGEKRADHHSPRDTSLTCPVLGVGRERWEEEWPGRGRPRKGEGGMGCPNGWGYVGRHCGGRGETSLLGSLICIPCSRLEVPPQVSSGQSSSYVPQLLRGVVGSIFPCGFHGGRWEWKQWCRDSSQRQQWRPVSGEGACLSGSPGEAGEGRLSPVVQTKRRRAAGGHTLPGLAVAEVWDHPQA